MLDNINEFIYSNNINFRCIMINTLDEALSVLADCEYVIDITDENLTSNSRDIYFALNFFIDFLDETDPNLLINTVKYPFIDWLDEREIYISEIFVDCNLVEIEDSNDLTLDSYLTPYGCMMFALYRKFVLKKDAAFDFFCIWYGLSLVKRTELLFRFVCSNNISNDLIRILEKQDNKKSKKVNLESDVVNKLINREKLKCKREVSTPTGRIDILTDSELIEVKEYSNYKSAIGQLICYGNSYPKHKLRLHLFNVKEKSVDHIKLICDNLDIKLTFE